jgi:hypothetical protein
MPMNRRLLGAVLILIAALLWLGDRLERETWIETAENEVQEAREPRPETLKDFVMLRRGESLPIDQVRLRSARQALEVGKRSRAVRGRAVLFFSIALGGGGLILVIFGGRPTT